MMINPIDVLKEHQEDATFGSVAKAALKLIEGDKFRLHNWAAVSTPSFDIARIWKVRWGSKNIKRKAFRGVEESIERLSEKNIAVRSAILEGEQWWVSVWLPEDSRFPLAIILIRFDL